MGAEVRTGIGAGGWGGDVNGDSNGDKDGDGNRDRMGIRDIKGDGDRGGKRDRTEVGGCNGDMGGDEDNGASLRGPLPHKDSTLHPGCRELGVLGDIVGSGDSGVPTPPAPPTHPHGRTEPPQPQILPP